MKDEELRDVLLTVRPSVYPVTRRGLRVPCPMGHPINLTATVITVTCVLTGLLESSTFPCHLQLLLWSQNYMNRMNAAGVNASYR
jgi:hypothetical protein